MISLLLTAVVLCCLSTAFIVRLRRALKYWKERNIPGPGARFITGTLWRSLLGKCSVVEELHEIYLHYRATQKFVGIFSGVCPKLFVLHPKLARAVMKDHFSSFHDNEASQWTSSRVEQLRICSPFVSTGEDWKSRRAELTPALTLSRLRASYPAMREAAAHMTALLETQLAEGPVDAKELAHRYTAEFMSNFIWGVESEAVCRTTFSTVHSMADSMVSQGVLCSRFFQRTGTCPWLRRLWSVRFFPAQSDRFFTSLTQSAVASRMTQRVERNDFVKHLLKLRSMKPLNDTQIAGHATTILIDGFETAAVLISNCLLLLSRNSRVQEKLRAELLGLAEHELTFEALNALAFLDQCLQETLRIFPPLTLLSKLCTNRTVLGDGGVGSAHVQKGDVVYISTYSFHHDAEFFERPEEFCPERFDAELGGAQKYRERGVFLPFGDGPRMCLGMKMGLLEAKVGVAEIVRHFEVSSSRCTRKDNRVSADSFLTTLSGGIRLRFRKL